MIFVFIILSRDRARAVSLPAKGNDGYKSSTKKVRPGAVVCVIWNNFIIVNYLFWKGYKVVKLFFFNFFFFKKHWKESELQAFHFFGIFTLVSVQISCDEPRNREKKGKFCPTPLLKGICWFLWISRGNFPAVCSVTVRTQHQTGQSCCCCLQEMKFGFVFFVVVAWCAHPQPTLTCSVLPTPCSRWNVAAPQLKPPKKQNSSGVAVPQVTLMLPPKLWWLLGCAAPSPSAPSTHLGWQCQHSSVLKIK